MSDDNDGCLVTIGVGLIIFLLWIIAKRLDEIKRALEISGG